jgi:hypothetical protein
LKNPFQEFFRYAQWKERFLKDYEEINSKDLSLLESSLQGFDVEKTERLLKALASMYVGGYEKRLEDEDVRYWTNWAGIKTYRTFGGFPRLSDVD